MILKYPLGLLALLGIPIVILIYIIKSKYTEQVIASTYLWRLSEKFLKNKKPKPKISGLISLILEIVAIICAALIISQPVITIPHAAKEYLFMLDASGSMNTISDGKSRLEYGKEEINKIIDSSYDGSSYTVITCKDKPEILFEGLKDKKKTKEIISGIDKTDMEGHCVDSLGFAQYYFNNNQGIMAYLITDKEYEGNNINLINVNKGEDNYALAEANLELVNDKSMKYLLSGKAISYLSDQTLEVALYLDDVLKDSKEIAVKKGEARDFTLKADITDYKKISVKILNKDGLLEDNERIFYNLDKAHDYRVLLVSDRPSFIKNILKPNDSLSVEIISMADYEAVEGAKLGYSLYIFDSYNPKRLPEDGAIWIFNPTDNIKGSGFTFQETVDSEKPVVLDLKNKSSHSLVERLTKGLIGTDVYVKKYNKLGLISRFTVLYEYDGLPMVFTGTNDSGNREVVFAFDLHDSNFPLQLDYITLAKNLIDFSFPVIIENNSYICGETLAINVIPGCDSIRVISPSGRASYIDATGLISEYLLEEVGSYKVVLNFSGTEKVFDIFSSLPENESNDVEIEAFDIKGDKTDSMLDGIYDKLIVLFIILAIVYMADWMVYCYEQYQLR